MDQNGGKDARDRLELAIEATDLGTWEFDNGTREVRWSNRGKASFGLPPDAEVTYERFLSLIHPEDRGEIDRLVKRAWDPSGDGLYAAQYRVLHPDATVRWISARGRSLFE